LKCKVYWYCFKQFTGGYNSYNEFVGSLNISIKKDIIGIIRKNK
jgi:hypothetical protein